MSVPIRIVLLDDHGLFREGLARLLNSEPGLSVVGHCASIDEAIVNIARQAVDLLLVDYDLGQEVGTNIIANLAVLKPAPRILIVTAGMTQKAVRDALDAGVLEVVLKHSGPQRLIDAIRSAMEQDINAPKRQLVDDLLPSFSDGRVNSFANPIPNSIPNSIQDRPLTRRQSNALHAILDGLSNREIAARLNMSESSVKAIVQELFDKAGVRTRSQLVRVAIEKHMRDWIKSE
jgi:DNA-binding NarL/FixJ family response regulator